MNDFIFLGDTAILNHMGSSIKLEKCGIIQCDFSQHVDDDLTYDPPDFGGKGFTPPSRFTLDLRIEALKLTSSPNEISFKQVLQANLSIEDLFKIINKKMKKTRRKE